MNDQARNKPLPIIISKWQREPFQASLTPQKRVMDETTGEFEIVNSTQRDFQFITVELSGLNDPKETYTLEIPMNVRSNDADVVRQRLAHAVHYVRRCALRYTEGNDQEKVLAAGLNILSEACAAMATLVRERGAEGTSVIDSDEQRAVHLEQAARAYHHLAEGKNAGGTKSLPLSVQLQRASEVADASADAAKAR